MYSRVYPFTNENLTSFQSFIDFNGKNVLSVIGSTDQYFSFLLYNAKNVDLFDINPNSEHYFLLKFYSIFLLTYEEFIDFFVSSKLDNMSIYNKVRYYLPLKTKTYFDNYIKSGKKLSDLIFTVSLNSNPINYSTNRVIPYFDKDSYYILQSMLRNIEMPKIYICSLEKLYKELKDIYDIIVLSNIYLLMNMSVKQYRKFLDSYLSLLNSNGIIEAYYSWNNIDEKEFIDSGFTQVEVPSIRLVREEEFKDYVYLLKK